MSRGKLREIKKRISSTKSTMQITKAMQMVASARTNKVQKQIKAVRDYANYAKKIIGKISPDPESPFVKSGDGTLIVVITPDMGLCGSFTSDISKRALEESKKCADFKGFIVIGSKGMQELRHTGNVLINRSDLYDIPSSENAQFILDDIIDIMNKESISKVKVVYGEYKNPLIQKPETADILPIKYEQDSITNTYEFEPEPEILFEEASYLYVLSQVYMFMFETKISELYARRNAMQNATENAKNLIDEFTLDYNKLRQASITTELIEIVNGAQALQQE